MCDYGASLDGHDEESGDSDGCEGGECGRCVVEEDERAGEGASARHDRRGRSRHCLGVRVWDG